MIALKPLLLSCAGAALLVASAMPVRADDWDDCRTENPDKLIAGCTAVIEKHERRDEDIALAHRRRGVWYARRNMLDRAMPDFDNAVRLAPSSADALIDRAFGHRRGNLDQAFADNARALRAFWSAGDLWFRAASFPGHLGHAQNWFSVVHTRLFGSSGHFRPRLPSAWGPFRSLYDLAPMKERLERLIDFGRLNSGAVGFGVAATDIETGELVVFDPTKGDQISIDHLLASCGFLPEFAPVEIGGRLLGDGGLSANAPIEVLGNGAANGLVFVIDLFARDGERPGPQAPRRGRDYPRLLHAGFGAGFRRLSVGRERAAFARAVPHEEGDPVRRGVGGRLPPLGVHSQTTSSWFSRRI